MIFEFGIIKVSIFIGNFAFKIDVSSIDLLQSICYTIGTLGRRH